MNIVKKLMGFEDYLKAKGYSDGNNFVLANPHTPEFEYFLGIPEKYAEQSAYIEGFEDGFDDAKVGQRVVAVLGRQPKKEIDSDQNLIRVAYSRYYDEKQVTLCRNLGLAKGEAYALNILRTHDKGTIDEGLHAAVSQYENHPTAFVGVMLQDPKLKSLFFNSFVEGVKRTENKY